MDNNFIKLWQMPELSVCDDLITYWKNNEKFSGSNYTPSKGVIINKEEKDSLEVSIDVKTTISKIVENYLKNLQIAVNEYIQEFPYCNNYAPWGITDTINIQYYPPGGGYKIWHCERCSSMHPVTSRHLVFMTYLNDVNDCGETEFFHQNLKIKPKKGLTVIWPADWTYTHRGIPSMTEEKYIITGWLNFIK
jgi:hypothetical protein